MNSALAADAPATNTSAPAQTVNQSPSPHFNIRAYVVRDNGLLPTNVWASILSKYTGTNVALEEIVRGAAELQTAYRDRGYPLTSVAVAREQIANGIVTLNVFQTTIPQIVVSGVRYYCPTNGGMAMPAFAPVLVPATAAACNAPPAPAVPLKPASPEQIAEARASLFKEMAELDREEKDTRIHVVSTNAGPYHFDVERYRIIGNSILSPKDMAMILTNIDGAFGTNVSLAGVHSVVEQLQKAYSDRGYITVLVGLPQQTLSNATVKVEVIEGRLTSINVEGNRYFSSNNVMRALPSLHTNMIVNKNVFQAELNRANANPERQIYPVIGPGTNQGTSVLTLHVKDQLPLHAKLEFDNEYSPGTPPLRVNSSAVEDNLWQLEHSLGVQYGFSPDQFKRGEQWSFYDQPGVADYSGFYRLPLGSPASVENQIENSAGAFGYDEATRQFNLPPATGQTELNVYASRATIDTGLQPLYTRTPINRTNLVVTEGAVEQGITINEDVGFQLSKPLPQMGGIFSTLSGGLDYKAFSQQNFETNFFNVTGAAGGGLGGSTNATSPGVLPTPPTFFKVDYLPLELAYNANANDFFGPVGFGLSLSANLWFSSSTTYTATSTNPPPANLTGRKSLDTITASPESTGYWVILKPSFSQTFIGFNDWTTTVRADGQWASEPLISNEQFGIGGVNSVRGYHEGEIFGDTGWHLSLEEDTPPHVVGTIYDGQPLTIRGSLYMDGATAYLLDPPPGVRPYTKLWSTGFGVMASVGPYWKAQFLFSLPLIDTVYTPRFQPYFNFALTAQF